MDIFRKLIIVLKNILKITDSYLKDDPNVRNKNLMWSLGLGVAFTIAIMGSCYLIDSLFGKAVLDNVFTTFLCGSLLIIFIVFIWADIHSR